MLVQASQVLVAIVDATHCGCALPMDLAAVAIPPPIKAHATSGMSSMPMVQVKKSLMCRAVIVRGAGTGWAPSGQDGASCFAFVYEPQKRVS